MVDLGTCCSPSDCGRAASAIAVVVVASREVRNLRWHFLGGSLRRLDSEAVELCFPNGLPYPDERRKGG